MRTHLWKSGATAVLFTIPALLVSLSTAAHEPEKHAENAQAPDCTAMENMDQDKIDKDDPVMQAMMEQCKGHMESMGHDSQSSADSDHHGKSGKTASESSKHRH